ncbi:MAG: ABC transporter permease [Candidatus Limnocylindrales bacterium]
MTVDRGSLRNAGLIARREYLQWVRRRAFIVSTVVLAIVVLVLGQAPVALQALERGSQAKLGIVVGASASRLVTDPVADATAILSVYASSSGGSPPFVVSGWTDTAAATAALRRGDLRAVMVVGRGPDGRLMFDVRSDANPAGSQAVYLRLAATWIATRDALQRANATEGGSALIGSFAIHPLSGSAAAPTEVQTVGNLILATVLVILVFITIMAYGMWIATSVAEEKSSRVMELMLGAATPLQMLSGKVVGVGAAGLTQYALLIGAGLVGLLLQGPVGRIFFGATSGGPPISGLSVGILAGFIVFFILGFALYAFLYAAAGSLVSRQEDVQQVAMPMIALSMAGYFSASFAVSAVDAPWVAPLSFVPFFSPFVMLVRLTEGRASLAEIALAAALLAATIAVVMWIAARVYTTGVLMYGQRPGVRAFLAAARSRR